MKKFLYLCGAMLLCMNMMAQIDLNDQNWECFIDEDFSGIRSWNDLYWEDQKNEVNYQSLWRCFSYEDWGSGVTGASYERHAYQRTNSVFDNTNHTLRLVGDFKSQQPMNCSQNGVSSTSYSPAPWLKYCHYCDALSEQHPCVHYYSGMIETIDPVGYGYYEIKCKMPVHNGACSAFWFWSNLGHTYNEIDVFEHSTNLTPNLNRQTLSGIWYNPYGSNLNQIEDENGNIIVPKAIRYANHLHTLPNNVSTLDEYHRFGCLWMPEKVLFYVDGELVNEFDDPDLIPTHPMWLKITHLEDINARIGFDNNLDTIWGDWHDEMTIDYIRGYRLKTACDSDIVIRSIADFNSFVYNTKHTITMGGQNSPLTLPDTINFTMRAVESITIDGQFELPIGAQMTLMAQECPQCSMEGVDLPSYGCGMNNEDE